MVGEKRKLEEESAIQRPIVNRPPRENKTNVDDKKTRKVEKEPKSNEEVQAEMKQLREKMKNDVKLYKEKITSSYIYADDKYQYRHITLPKEIADYLPDSMCLLKESEYRQLGVEISAGWEHYMIHAPEPNILLLRRSHELSKKIEEERKAKKLKEKAAKEKESSSTSSTTIKKSSVASK